jgi:hypothetical protein
VVKNLTWAALQVLRSCCKSTALRIAVVVACLSADCWESTSVWRRGFGGILPDGLCMAVKNGTALRVCDDIDGRFSKKVVGRLARRTAGSLLSLLCMAWPQEFNCAYLSSGTSCIVSCCVIFLRMYLSVPALCLRFVNLTACILILWISLVAIWYLDLVLQDSTWGKLQ